MVLFISVVAYSCEMTFDYMFLIEREKSKQELVGKSYAKKSIHATPHFVRM